MKRNAISQFIIGSIFLILFILFTCSLRFVNVQPIGPNQSPIAYADTNQFFHGLFSFNLTLYNITDWAGDVTVLIALGFSILGLCQWIKRKDIHKVDHSILSLGVFYILVFGTYMFFELHVVNYRPVLLDGILEPSYPSSTTMLTMCILPTAAIQFRRRIQNQKTRRIITLVCNLFTIFTVIGRLICGVHWLTDILGGMLFSIGAVLLYCSANSYIAAKKNDAN